MGFGGACEGDERSFAARDEDGDELIFCSDEERDGGLGRVGGGVETEAESGDRGRDRGEERAFRLARLGGLLKALVSDG